MKKILVTGGAGYIGSHMVKLLLENGYEVIVVDNFSNSTEKNLNTIKKMTKKDFKIVNADLTKGLDLDEKIDAIIHFAAFKGVGESVEKPLEYYKNNTYGTVNLLNFAKEKNIKKFIFSSTSAVYGIPEESEMVDEKSPVKPVSPYGSSKLISEQIIRDCNKAFGLNAVILRYFNVAGNVDEGEIGDTQKNPLNLISVMIMSYLGYKPTKLQIFGNDYDTKDGTGVRDFIHVLDLVEAHLKALEYLDKNKGVELFNLGTGNGYSVMEVIKTFEKIAGGKVDYEIVGRRTGDVASITTNTAKALKLLGWKPSRGIESMVDSSWRWYKNNYQLAVSS